MKNNYLTILLVTILAYGCEAKDDTKSTSFKEGTDRLQSTANAVLSRTDSLHSILTKIDTTILSHHFTIGITGDTFHFSMNDSRKPYKRGISRRNPLLLPCIIYLGDTSFTLQNVAFKYPMAYTAIRPDSDFAPTFLYTFPINKTMIEPISNMETAKDAYPFLTSTTGYYFIDTTRNNILAIHYQKEPESKHPLTILCQCFKIKKGKYELIHEFSINEEFHYKNPQFKAITERYIKWAKSRH